MKDTAERKQPAIHSVDKMYAFFNKARVSSNCSKNDNNIHKRFAFYTVFVNIFKTFVLESEIHGQIRLL